MKIKTKFILITIFLLNFSLAFANFKELEKNFISQKDFIVLKFDLFIQKNLNNIFKGGGITGVAYQKIDYKLEFKKNEFNISLDAFMDEKRYKSKKYYPKVKDCNQIRNKLFTGQYGYSFFSQKLNNLVNEDVISDSINKKILNITNLNNKLREEILDKTNINIEIFHPNSQKNLQCFGNIADTELKNK